MACSPGSATTTVARRRLGLLSDVLYFRKRHLPSWIGLAWGLHAIAEELKQRGIRTAHGGEWTAARVRSVLLREGACWSRKGAWSGHVTPRRGKSAQGCRRRLRVASPARVRW